MNFIAAVEDDARGAAIFDEDTVHTFAGADFTA
jgi:hypothetical protein